VTDYPLLYTLSEDGRMVIFCSDCGEEMDEAEMMPVNVWCPPIHINECGTNLKRPLLGVEHA
jgi:hypothetical protein